MDVFIRAMERIFSFGERWNVPFNLSPHENILTIALINIPYIICIIVHVKLSKYFALLHFSAGQPGFCSSIRLRITT
jgi:hypothetical protein